MKILAAILLVAISAQAYTVRGGLNLSKFLVDEDMEMDLKFDPGFHISVMREFPRNYGNMHVGVGIENRGTRAEEKYQDSYESVENKYDITLTYIIVPVGVQFENRSKTGSRPYLALRLVPSFLMSATADFEFSYEGYYGDYSDSDSEDIEEYVKGFDLLAEAEAGLYIPRAGTEKRWLLGVAAGYGLSNGFEPEDSADDVDVKNLVLRVFAGMEF